MPHFHILGWGPHNTVKKYSIDVQNRLKLRIYPKKNCQLYYRSFSELQKIEEEILFLKAEQKNDTSIFIGLVGHSYGGAAAYQLSHKLPMLDLLLLIDPVGCGNTNWLSSCRLDKFLKPLQKPPVKKFAACLIYSPWYLRGNLISQIGQAWRNKPDICQFLADNCDLLIKIIDTKIGHAHFSALMQYGDNDDSLESFLIDEIYNFLNKP